MQRTVDQIRAGYAWNAINGWNATQREDRKSDCQRLPAMLVTNGLLATWAFLCADGGRRVVAKSVLEYLQQLDAPDPVRAACSAHADPIAVYNAWIQTLSPLQLRLVTDEVVAFSIWLKRSAEILIPD